MVRSMVEHEDEISPGDRASEGTPADGMPRWVKLFLAVGLALLLVVVALKVFGGGQHGPGRHLPGAAIPVVLAGPLGA